MKDLKNHIYGLLFALCFAALPPCAEAQTDTPPPRQASKETELETIRKCIMDLASADDDLRLRAVMILGKYQSPLAIDAVARALTDAKSRIRHSAAVALSEKRTLPTMAKAAMLKRLDDEDTHVRRVVSSHILYLLPRRGSSLSYTFVNGQAVAQPAQANAQTGMPASTLAKLNNAYADKDAVVRKNMVDKYSYLRTYVKVESLLPLLHDEDRDVRSLTLDAIRNSVPISALLKHAAHLATDKDPVIRLRAAEVFASSTTTDAANLLETLSKDSDFRVSTEALVSLHRMKRKNCRADLVRRLEDPRMSEKTAARIIYSLPTSDDPAVEILIKLLDHRKSAYRLAALSTLQRTRVEVPQENLAKLLKDSGISIRRQALYAARLNKSLTKSFVQDLTRNPHKDVRMAIPQFIGSIDRESAATILEDLMLDEDPDVRVSSISSIVSTQARDWEDSLGAALDVEDISFAYRLLRKIAIRPTPALRTALEKISPTLPAEKQNLIRAQLRRTSGSTIRVTPNLQSIPKKP